MEAAPPSYHTVLSNILKYPLFNPAIHHVPAPTPQQPQTYQSNAPPPVLPDRVPSSGEVLSRGSRPTATHSAPSQHSLPAHAVAAGASLADAEQEEESDFAARPKRYGSDPVHLGSSTPSGAGRAASAGRFSPPPSSAAHPHVAAPQPARPALSVESILAPISEEERRRRFAERLMDEPMSLAYVSAPRPAAPAAALSHASLRSRQPEAVEVQEVKWLWEPDDGSTRWVPYDAPLCQKIERHFQLWIMASSTTCAICASRRAAFPGGIGTIQSSFLHQFRPDLVAFPNAQARRRHRQRLRGMQLRFAPA